MEILTPEGAHGDYAADTPFPAISVGDIISAEGFVTGGTIGVPSETEMRVTRVEHHLKYWESPREGEMGFHHFTTVLFTEYQPKKMGL